MHILRWYILLFLASIVVPKSVVFTNNIDILLVSFSVSVFSYILKVIVLKLLDFEIGEGVSLSTVVLVIIVMYLCDLACLSITIMCMSDITMSLVAEVMLTLIMFKLPIRVTVAGEK